ncbi:NUDIX hydrolase [Patescibacteria group bacterium]|nr:NUDIX hydrolase [Patescibacteria group bacterium]MCG2809457.1 NUDIX hydrolase [Candidatus Portnoybacteria bacterium]
MSTKIKIGVIIVNERDEILLIKEKLENKPNHLWNIIKGTYGDNGKETIFETAIRECQEEAGVNVKLTNLLGCYIAQRIDKTRIQFNFLAKIVEGEPTLANKKEQESRNECINELKWFSKDDLIKINRDAFISERAYAAVRDWIKGKSYSLDAVRHTEL